ncbi:MAG: PrpR N-terminal domain-containing protein [Lachnospiraceae bacterium]|nr:PrpR N-terminal domain-containing protein [Lachnospiraceae bacterium]
MGKIALLIPRAEVLYQAHNILQEKKYAIDEMRVIHTEDSVVEARKSIADGANIIIARGLQASLIKQYTDIPVVEIVITAQEMALLVTRAKQIIKKEVPVIAVVGFKNMFCDMSYFNDIYGIEFRTYFAKGSAELKAAAETAIADGVDLVIGGDTAVAVASEHKVSSLFLSTTEDSLRNAFSVAESMNYAMGVEKRNNAQMETLMDYSFSGVVKMDQNGRITVVNRIMEDIMECDGKTLIGKPVIEVFHDVDEGKLKEVLWHGLESYAVFMQYNKTSLYAILAPITVENRVDGAILSCHKMQKKTPVAQEVLKQRYQQGLIARGRFGDIVQLSKTMQDTVYMAKLYSQSNRPILIVGETGTERRLLAQSIHNNSIRSDEPFVMISCDGLAGENQKELIFGDQGSAVVAGKGTLLIQEVDKLSLDNQYSLFQLIRYKIRRQSLHAELRVIATSKVSLEGLVEKGVFLEDLYYVLNGLTILVPPLRERREDLKKIIQTCVKSTCDTYSRYQTLTEGAMNILLNYPWKGNLLQVESFCERLILMVQKRNIDEAAVKKLLKELYPTEGTEKQAGMQSGEKPQSGYQYQSQEAIRLIEALQEFSGNRQQTAKKLGISTATLWRHMKKYGIQEQSE